MRKLEEEYEAIPEVEIDRKKTGKVLVGRLEAIAKKNGANTTEYLYATRKPDGEIGRA